MHKHVGLTLIHLCRPDTSLTGVREHRLHISKAKGSLLKGAIFPFDKIPRVQRAIWQGGRDDLINSPIVDSDWIGGFELLLHLGFRLGKLSMCL